MRVSVCSKPSIPDMYAHMFGETYAEVWLLRLHIARQALYVAPSSLPWRCMVYLLHSRVLVSCDQ